MTLSSKIEFVRRTYKLIILFGCITLAVALAGFIVIGSYMRYSGDDYCYGATLTQMGFWKAQLYSYQNTMPYSGNRYSLTLFYGISGQLSPRLLGLLPGLAVVLWLIASAWAVCSVFKLASLRQSAAEVMLIAGLLVFFSLAVTPSISQSLYWRSGMLTYLAPLIGITFLIAWIFQLMQVERVSWLSLTSLSGLAFLTGGFSETGVSLQAASIGLILLASLGAMQAKPQKAARALLLGAAAMFGTFLAMLGLTFTLFIVPLLHPKNMHLSPDLVAGIITSLKFAFDYWSGAYIGPALSNTYNFFVPLLVSLLFVWQHPQQSIPKRKYLLVLGLLVLLSSYMLVFACMLPNVLGQSNYPPPRAMITARFVVVLNFAALGWLAGLGIAHAGRQYGRLKPYFLFGGLAVLAILCAYPLRTAVKTFATVPTYQKWAAFWDTRDAEIRRAKQNGIKDIDVVKIDKIIPQVSELKPDPSFWYNTCAAGYYGVKSIRAVLPGWDQ
jgi:hypothetical protein